MFSKDIDRLFEDPASLGVTPEQKSEILLELYGKFVHGLAEKTFQYIILPEEMNKLKKYGAAITKIDTERWLAPEIMGDLQTVETAFYGQRLNYAQKAQKKAMNFKRMLELRDEKFRFPLNNPEIESLLTEQEYGVRDFVDDFVHLFEKYTEPERLDEGLLKNKIESGGKIENVAGASKTLLECLCPGNVDIMAEYIGRLSSALHSSYLNENLGEITHLIGIQRQIQNSKFAGLTCPPDLSALKHERNNILVQVYLEKFLKNNLLEQNKIVDEELELARKHSSYGAEGAFGFGC